MKKINVKFDFMCNGTIKEQLDRKIVEIKELRKSETKVEKINTVKFIDRPTYKAKEKINGIIDKVKFTKEK